VDYTHSGQYLPDLLVVIGAGLIVIVIYGLFLTDNRPFYTLSKGFKVLTVFGIVAAIALELYFIYYLMQVGNK
jgi:hypothetical protein